MKLSGKKVLITGAAGQLGRQYCRAFAREGADVIAADIQLAACRQVIGELAGESKNHLALACDVSNPASVESAFAAIEKRFGTLDVLINNAGIAVFGSFEDRNFEDFMKVFRINAGGTFLCTKAASKLMRESGVRGVIINIGSIYGMVSSDPRIYTDSPRYNSECYSGSKAAVIQMTKYFAVHLAPYGIRVNCISPGGVFNGQGDDFVKNYGVRSPMGRMAKEDELTATAIFLASDGASYITGQNIAVDGGWTAW